MAAKMETQTLQLVSKSLLYLPSEFIDLILSFLDYKSLLQVSLTCRRLAACVFKRLSKTLAFYHCYFNDIPQLRSFLRFHESSWPKLNTPSIHLQPMMVNPDGLNPSSVNCVGSVPYGTLKINIFETWLDGVVKLCHLPGNVVNLEFTPHQRMHKSNDLVLNTVGYHVIHKFLTPEYMPKLAQLTLRIEQDDAFDPKTGVMKEDYEGFYKQFFYWLNVGISRYKVPQIDVRILACCPIKPPSSLSHVITTFTCRTTEKVIDMIGILYLASRLRFLKVFICSSGGPSISKAFHSKDPRFMLFGIKHSFGKLEHLETFEYLLPLQLGSDWLPTSIKRLSTLNFPGFLWKNKFSTYTTMSQLRHLTLEVRHAKVPTDIISVPFDKLTVLEIYCAPFKQMNAEVSALVTSIVSMNPGLEVVKVPKLSAASLVFLAANAPNLRVLNVLLEFEDNNNESAVFTVSQAFGYLRLCPKLEHLFLSLFTGQVMIGDMFDVVDACKELKSLLIHQIHDYRMHNFDFERYADYDSRVGALKELDVITRGLAAVPQSVRNKKRKRFLFLDEPPIRKAMIEERARSLEGGRYEFFKEYGMFPDEYNKFYEIQNSVIAGMSDEEWAIKKRHRIEMIDEENDNSLEGSSEPRSALAREPCFDGDILETVSEEDFAKYLSLLDVTDKRSPFIEDSKANPVPPWPVHRPLGEYRDIDYSVLYEKPSNKVPNFQTEYYPWPGMFWFHEVEQSRESFFSSLSDLGSIPHIHERRVHDVVYARFLDSTCHNNVLCANISKLRNGATSWKNTLHQAKMKAQAKAETEWRQSECTKDEPDSGKPGASRMWNKTAAGLRPLDSLDFARNVMDVVKALKK